MNERLAWTGIVLAGGRSRRFGGIEKGRLMVGGRSLRRRSLDVLSAVTDHQLIVGGQPDAAIRTIADEHPGQGPVGGMLTALTNLTTTHALIVACDLPFLTADLLRAVQTAGSAMPMGCIEMSDGRSPLCLSLHRDTRAAIAAYWDAGGRRVGSLLRLLPHRTVPRTTLDRLDPSGRLLLNVNDPLTYARALAEARHDWPASYFTDLDESKRTS